MLVTFFFLRGIFSVFCWFGGGVWISFLSVLCDCFSGFQKLGGFLNRGFQHAWHQVLHQDVVVRALEIFQDQRPKILMFDHDKKSGGAAASEWA